MLPIAYYNVPTALYNLAWGNAPCCMQPSSLALKGQHNFPFELSLQDNGLFVNTYSFLGRCPRLNCVARCLSILSLLSFLKPRFASAHRTRNINSLIRYFAGFEVNSMRLLRMMSATGSLPRKSINRNCDRIQRPSPTGTMATSLPCHVSPGP